MISANRTSPLVVPAGIVAWTCVVAKAYTSLSVLSVGLGDGDGDADGDAPVGECWRISSVCVLQAALASTVSAPPSQENNPPAELHAAISYGVVVGLDRMVRPVIASVPRSVAVRLAPNATTQEVPSVFCSVSPLYDIEVLTAEPIALAPMGYPSGSCPLRTTIDMDVALVEVPEAVSVPSAILYISRCELELDPADE